jgi:hypothetical protein
MNEDNIGSPLPTDKLFWLDDGKTVIANPSVSKEPVRMLPALNPDINDSSSPFETFNQPVVISDNSKRSLSHSATKLLGQLRFMEAIAMTEFRETTPAVSSKEPSYKYLAQSKGKNHKANTRKHKRKK